MNFFNIGPMELLLILTVVMILFGPDKIPDIAGSIGKMLGQFRQASKDITEELDLEDLSPSSIANALEAKAAADEKNEMDGTAEGKTPPALPATTGSAETPAATESSEHETAPGAGEASKQRFHLPPELQAEPGAGEAPTQRFHLPPELQAKPSQAAAADAAALTVDYESPEDAN